MFNKNRTQILENRVQGETRYACHSNGIVPCAERKDVAERAQTCWRRNPHTGRLEMHWQVPHARQPKTLPTPDAWRRIRAHAKIKEVPPVATDAPALSRSLP
jgi:hypothetical protein